MTLSTSEKGPTGTIELADDVFLEGGPDFWFGGVAKYSPDADGFFWGITGTVAKPIFKIGCYTDFRWRDNIQMTDVRCDTIGVVATIQKRNYLEAQFTLMSLLPLSSLRNIIRGGAVTVNGSEHTEKMGIGLINNAIYHMVYFSRVYDEDTGDFLSVTGHRCQFVDAWEMALQYGAPWTLGVRLRMFADDTKPSAQKFATVLRLDPSMVP